MEHHTTTNIVLLGIPKDQSFIHDTYVEYTDGTSDYDISAYH